MLHFNDLPIRNLLCILLFNRLINFILGNINVILLYTKYY